jgi:rhamnopyranosyl-N-acetylglucosaminyl-diphospho-decaprenol beta-1,3/1,4-galactofuranosyltransferase
MPASEPGRRRLAALVLARDRPAALEETLAAILAQGRRPEALIVVGNDPTPEVRSILERAAALHDDGHCIALSHNLGAAGGFHAGIEYALSRDDIDDVCCFDDDATPLPGCLRALCDAAAALPSVGSVGALTHDGTGRLSWPLHVVGEKEVVLEAAVARSLAAQSG